MGPRIRWRRTARRKAARRTGAWRSCWEPQRNDERNSTAIRTHRSGRRFSPQSCNLPGDTADSDCGPGVDLSLDLVAISVRSIAAAGRSHQGARLVMDEPGPGTGTVDQL